MQRSDPADAVGQIAAEPAADGRGQQRHGAGKTGGAGIDLPQRDDGADHQRIDHEIHAVERPAGGAGPERPPLRQVHVAVKGEKAGVFDRCDFDRAAMAARWCCSWCFSPGNSLAGTRFRLRGRHGARFGKSTPIADAVISNPPVRAKSTYSPAANAPRVRGSGAPNNPSGVTAIELAEVWPSGSITVWPFARKPAMTSSGKPCSIRTSSGSH